LRRAGSSTEAFHLRRGYFNDIQVIIFIPHGAPFFRCCI
jgi:hypothetical protein